MSWVSYVGFIAYRAATRGDLISSGVMHGRNISCRISSSRPRLVVSFPRRRSALTRRESRARIRDDRSIREPTHVLVNTRGEIGSCRYAARVSFSTWWRDYFCPFSVYDAVGFGPRNRTSDGSWQFFFFFFFKSVVLIAHNGCAMLGRILSFQFRLG